MQVQPILQSLVDRAKALDIKKIRLHFQGGSDEGYLNVNLEGVDVWGDVQASALATDIESWAWDVYWYSGAGDGSDYGDDITYDLETGKVTSQSWYHQATYEGEVDEGSFETVPDGTDIESVSVD